MRYFFVRWWSLFLGLAIGLAGGLFYTWTIDPVELINTDPSLLRVDYQQDWVRLAALSYVATGNMERALGRLQAVDSDTVRETLGAMIEEYAAAGHQARTMRNLATLAQIWDVQTPAMWVYLGTLAPSPRSPTETPTFTPTPTPSPSPTDTPRPSPTLTRRPTRTPTITPTSTLNAESPLLTPTPRPTATPLPPTLTPPLIERLQLAEQEQICQPNQEPRIEVVVRDERDRGLTGVAVWLIWPGGADRAVTGLKSDPDEGYVDFSAERGVNYSVGVGALGRPLVTNLRIERCPVEGDPEIIFGSWRLTLAPNSPDDEDD